MISLSDSISEAVPGGETREQITGHSDFVEWPPRLNDLTPEYFLLCGYRKQQMYFFRPSTKHDINDALRNLLQMCYPLYYNMKIKQRSKYAVHLMEII